MSGMKRFAEQIAAELGKDDIMDPEVIEEAERRIFNGEIEAESNNENY